MFDKSLKTRKRQRSSLGSRLNQCKLFGMQEIHDVICLTEKMIKHKSSKFKSVEKNISSREEKCHDSTDTEHDETDVDDIVSEPESLKNGLNQVVESKTNLISPKVDIVNETEEVSLISSRISDINLSQKQTSPLISCVKTSSSSSEEMTTSFIEKRHVGFSSETKTWDGVRSVYSDFDELLFCFLIKGKAIGDGDILKWTKSDALRVYTLSCLLTDLIYRVEASTDSKPVPCLPKGGGRALRIERCYQPFLSTLLTVLITALKQTKNNLTKLEEKKQVVDSLNLVVDSSELKKLEECIPIMSSYTSITLNTCSNINSNSTGTNTSSNPVEFITA